MVTFYCPACWAETPEGAATCPCCSADVQGVTDSRSYTAKLVAALSHPEPTTPVRAAKILGELRAAEAVGPLLDLVRQTRDPYTQAAAAEALGRIGAAESWPVLAELAENGPILARRQARIALSRMKPAEGGPGNE